MDNIQVGEYIRTKGGQINKVLEIKSDELHFIYCIDYVFFPYEIKNHSFNIMDLIEVRRLC